MIELAIEYMQLLIFGAPQGNRGAQTNSEKWAFYEARYEKYPTCLYWVTSRGPQNPPSNCAAKSKNKSQRYVRWQCFIFQLKHLMAP